MVYPASARMHIIAYIFGLSYYMVAPMSLLCTQQSAVSGSSSIQPFLGIDTQGFTDPGQWVGTLAARAAAAPEALVNALQQAFGQTEISLSTPQLRRLLVSGSLSSLPFVTLRWSSIMLGFPEALFYIICRESPAGLSLEGFERLISPWLDSEQCL